MTQILALQTLDTDTETETAAFCISASWSGWSIHTA
ncbi:MULTISPECIES: class III lanthipeptide [unclassified Streptomyces]